MSTPQPDYSIISRAQVTKWDQQLQQAIDGWQLDVRWTSTGTILRVFVALPDYNATNVDAAIRTAGALDDQIARLGRPSTTPTSS